MIRWRLLMAVDRSEPGSGSSESRGLDRRTCDPIGQRNPSASPERTYRKSLSSLTCVVSPWGALTSGAPLGHRPTILLASDTQASVLSLGKTARAFSAQ